MAFSLMLIAVILGLKHTAADVIRIALAAVVNQLVHLDKSYPGGLLRYVANARSLLADSKAGTNPLDGYVPKVPEGVRLDPSSPDFWQMEQAGVAEAQVRHRGTTHGSLRFGSSPLCSLTRMRRLDCRSRRLCWSRGGWVSDWATLGSRSRSRWRA